MLLGNQERQEFLNAGLMTRDCLTEAKVGKFLLIICTAKALPCIHQSKH